MKTRCSLEKYKLDFQKMCELNSLNRVSVKCHCFLIVTKRPSVAGKDHKTLEASIQKITVTY